MRADVQQVANVKVSSCEHKSSRCVPTLSKAACKILCETQTLQSAEMRRISVEVKD